MTESGDRPLLFLDVDGPLIPFGSDHGYPATFKTHEMRPEPWWVAENPLLVRLNPAHGPRLLALPCDLVWATAWGSDANDLIGPLIGLPELPVVIGPDDDQDQDQNQNDAPAHASPDANDSGLHWKTPLLLDWAAGRPFIWVDDEITDADRTWVTQNHPHPTLLHHVNHRIGLTEADFATLTTWLQAPQAPQGR
ncbi:MAG TPA: HAD domain-containing protein [Actinocrinis sp.]|nr:HAD domain-containing protein [Actinocrinis sp.]